MKESVQEYVKRVRDFEGEFATKGYKYLGWQLSFQNSDFHNCYLLGHMGGKPEGKKDVKTVVQSKAFSQRGTHGTLWCDECKLWWNEDSGD